MIRVFKIGGSIIEDNEALETFCKEFSSVDGPKVLVHGGGVLASELQEALGQKPEKIEGRRVTDADTLKAVTMAYSGWCNKTLVAGLQKNGCNAIGLSGCDADVIRARKREPLTLLDGKTRVDYGFVGDVTPASVNTEVLRSFLDMGLIPVICAINHDGRGQLLNTNADTVASSVASALGAELLCCFELDGVLSDINDRKSIIPSISEADFEKMKADGAVDGGMIPKIKNCIDALKNGAAGAVIRSARGLNAGGGTKIVL